MEKLCDSCCHVFINTTSVGMHPNVDESPLGDRPPKFTPDTGSVTVRTYNVPDDSATERWPNDPRLAIEITDTGAGIDPEYLPAIFSALGMA